MNLIEQLQSDVARHLRQLEDQEAQLEAELIETRKAIRSAKSYQAKLLKQHPNGEAVLPLADPDEEPETPEGQTHSPGSAWGGEAHADDDEIVKEWKPSLDSRDFPPASDHELTVEEYQAQRAEPEPTKVTPESLMAGERAERTRRRRKATTEEVGND